MTTPTAVEQEEERLFDELKGLLREIENPNERQMVLKRTIRRLRYATWWSQLMASIISSWKNSRPATLWLMIAIGALTPIVGFALFIIVSLWVE
ncbi:MULTISPECIES: hypothetical protein [Paenibacillus]|uniref:hypothetical protein n=1 Tax=Paenibacillus TaxID=44249 RepID=UPI0002FAA5C8|nr:hypothetical protein [Paenibacillus sp. PAMC 26794]